MITAANFADLEVASDASRHRGLVHGFGERSSQYPEGITTAKQIHSAIVKNARSVMGKNAGGEADALISKEAGVIVGIRTADCVPILLVDPSTLVVAAIHAGWRGTAEGIAASAVRSLMSEWQIDPRNLRAAIGPSIGSCCYEVGPEVAQRFGIRVSRPVHLDLPAINEMQLRAAGVSNIWKSGACTFCAMTGVAANEGYRFHSFRREREAAGRMVSFIGWQKHIGRTSQGPPGNRV
jgi:polyphenol oxidase